MIFIGSRLRIGTLSLSNPKSQPALMITSMAPVRHRHGAPTDKARSTFKGVGHIGFSSLHRLRDVDWDHQRHDTWIVDQLMQ